MEYLISVFRADRAVIFLDDILISAFVGHRLPGMLSISTQRRGILRSASALYSRFLVVLADN